MVAPNGARPMKKDHPKVPITISEIVETGKECFKAGANAIHFHMRDKKGQHVLDSGLCNEALKELVTSHIKIKQKMKIDKKRLLMQRTLRNIE